MYIYKLICVNKVELINNKKFYTLSILFKLFENYIIYVIYKNK